MCLGLRLVLFSQVFNFLLEEPDLPSAFQLDGAQLALQLNILVNLGIDLSILGLQLVKANLQ
jgi:hypothetical protein